MSKRKRRRNEQTPSLNDRDLQRLAEEYRANNPGKAMELLSLAEWMIDTGRWVHRRASAVAELLRQLRHALQIAKMEDEEFGRVRIYHAFKGGETQGRLWAHIDDMIREDMRESLQARSTGAFGIVKQIDRDKGYYNAKINPGDPIDISFNYDERLEHEKHSAEYEDRPPEEPQDGQPGRDDKPIPPKG